MPILGSANFKFESDDTKVTKSLKNIKTGLTAAAVAAGAMTAKWALFGKGILKNTNLLGKLGKVWKTVKETQLGFGKNLKTSIPLFGKATKAAGGFRAGLKGMLLSLAQLSSGLPVFSGFLKKLVLTLEGVAVGGIAAGAALGTMGGGAAAAGAAMTGLAGVISIAFIEAILIAVKSVGNLIQAIGVGLVNSAIEASKRFAVLEQATFGLKAALDSYTRATGKVSISTQQVVKDSLDLQRVTGLMSTTIQQAFTVMLEMSRVTGLTAEQIRQLIKRAADFASVSGNDFLQVILGIDQALRGFPQILAGMGVDLSKTALEMDGLGGSMGRVTSKAGRTQKALAGVNEFLKQTEFSANKAAEAMGSTLFGSMQAVESRTDLLQQTLAQASAKSIGPMIILFNKMKIALIDLITPLAGVVGGFRGAGGVFLTVIGTFIALSAKILILVGAWKLLTSVMSLSFGGTVALSVRFTQLITRITGLTVVATSFSKVFSTLFIPLFKNGVKIIGTFLTGILAIIPMFLRWAGVIGIVVAAAGLLFTALRTTDEELAASASEARRAAEELDGLIRSYEKLIKITDRTKTQNQQLKLAFEGITKIVPRATSDVKSLNKEMRLNLEIAKEVAKEANDRRIKEELEAFDRLQEVRAKQNSLLGQAQTLRSSVARLRREQDRELTPLIKDPETSEGKRLNARRRVLEINARITIELNKADKIDEQIAENEEKILQLRKDSGEVFSKEKAKDELKTREKILQLESKQSLQRQKDDSIRISQERTIQFIQDNASKASLLRIKAEQDSAKSLQNLQEAKEAVRLTTSKQAIETERGFIALLGDEVDVVRSIADLKDNINKREQVALKEGEALQKKNIDDRLKSISALVEAKRDLFFEDTERSDQEISKFIKEQGANAQRLIQEFVEQEDETRKDLLARRKEDAESELKFGISRIEEIGSARIKAQKELSRAQREVDSVQLADRGRFRKKELEQLRKIRDGEQGEFGRFAREKKTLNKLFELEKKALEKRLILKDLEKAKTKIQILEVEVLEASQAERSLDLFTRKQQSRNEIERRISAVKLEIFSLELQEQERLLTNSADRSVEILAQGNQKIAAQARQLLEENRQALRESLALDVSSNKAAAEDRLSIRLNTLQGLEKLEKDSALKSELLQLRVNQIETVRGERRLEQAGDLDLARESALGRAQAEEKIRLKFRLESQKDANEEILKEQERLKVALRKNKVETDIAEQRQVGLVGPKGIFGTADERKANEENLKKLALEKKILETSLGLTEQAAKRLPLQRQLSEEANKEVDRQKDILRARSEERKENLERLRITSQLAKTEGLLEADENTEARRNLLLRDRIVLLRRLDASLQKSQERARTKPKQSEEELQAFADQRRRTLRQIQRTSDELELLDDPVEKTRKVVTARLQDQSRIITSFIQNNFNTMGRAVDDTLASIILRTGDVKEVILAFNRELLAASIQFLRQIAVAKAAALFFAPTVPGLNIESGGDFITNPPRFASGGSVKRTGLAQVEKGEFVFKPSAVTALGEGFLSKLNRRPEIITDGPRIAPKTEVTIVNISDPSSVPRFLANNPQMIANIVSDDIRANGVVRRLILNPST